jgi:hypothetical protein
MSCLHSHIIIGMSACFFCPFPKDRPKRVPRGSGSTFTSRFTNCGIPHNVDTRAQTHNIYNMCPSRLGYLDILRLDSNICMSACIFSPFPKDRLACPLRLGSRVLPTRIPAFVSLAKCGKQYLYTSHPIVGTRAQAAHIYFHNMLNHLYIFRVELTVWPSVNNMKLAIPT